MTCGPVETPSAMALLLDSPTLNRRKLFEKFRDAFRQDFEFVDIRDELINHLLTENECRQIQDEPTTDRQLERLFFLLTYDEKKSIASFVDLIRQVYRWLSEDIEAYLRDPPEEIGSLDMFEKCINRSWMPNKRNVFVHRCELVRSLIKGRRRSRAF